MKVFFRFLTMFFFAIGILLLEDEVVAQDYISYADSSGLTYQLATGRSGVKPVYLWDSYSEEDMAFSVSELRSKLVAGAIFPFFPFSGWAPFKPYSDDFFEGIRSRVDINLSNLTDSLKTEFSPDMDYTPPDIEDKVHYLYIGLVFDGEHKTVKVLLQPSASVKFLEFQHVNGESNLEYEHALSEVGIYSYRLGDFVYMGQRQGERHDPMLYIKSDYDEFVIFIPTEGIESFSWVKKYGDPGNDEGVLFDTEELHPDDAPYYFGDGDNEVINGT